MDRRIMSSSTFPAEQLDGTDSAKKIVVAPSSAHSQFIGINPTFHAPLTQTTATHLHDTPQMYPPGPYYQMNIPVNSQQQQYSNNAYSTSAYHNVFMPPPIQTAYISQSSNFSAMNTTGLMSHQLPGFYPQVHSLPPRAPNSFAQSSSYIQPHILPRYSNVSPNPNPNNNKLALAAQPTVTQSRSMVTKALYRSASAPRKTKANKAAKSTVSPGNIQSQSQATNQANSTSHSLNMSHSGLKGSSCPDLSALTLTKIETDTNTERGNIHLTSDYGDKLGFHGAVSSRNSISHTDDAFQHNLDKTLASKPLSSSSQGFTTTDGDSSSSGSNISGNISVDSSLRSAQQKIVKLDFTDLDDLIVRVHNLLTRWGPDYMANTSPDEFVRHLLTARGHETSLIPPTSPFFSQHRFVFTTHTIPNIIIVRN